MMVLCLNGGLCYPGIYVCQSLLSGTFKTYVHCTLILVVKDYEDFEGCLMHAEVFSGKVYLHLPLPLKWIKKQNRMIRREGWKEA